MARIVVTGASGRLGRALVPQLAAQGLTPVPAGRAQGFDLRTGARLADLLAGADAVVHAATDPRHAEAVDVAGTALLVQAARRAGVAHLVYVSIVGVDVVPLGYYRAKRAAEELIEASDLPYSIVRGTQWFPFVADVAGWCGRLWAAPRDIELAPSDVGELAMLLTRRVLAGPSGGTVEFGGPERVLLTRAAKQVSGHRVLHPALPGPLGRSLRAGALLPGAGTVLGHRSWSDWLARGRP